jgi:hypothetical protein
MKLSEAIRLGAGAVKEDRAVYLSMNRPDPCGCALGTAMYAMGARSMLDYYDGTFKQWPWLALPGPKCPECECLHHGTDDIPSVAFTISVLHCAHKWTRERIAAWVATIEPQEQEQSIPAKVGNIGEFTPVEA